MIVRGRQTATIKAIMAPIHNGQKRNPARNRTTTIQAIFGPRSAIEKHTGQFQARDAQKSSGVEPPRLRPGGYLTSAEPAKAVLGALWGAGR